MRVSQSELTQIVAQASFISERLSNKGFKLDAAQLNKQQVSKRLSRWCQIVAQGNWKKFQRRLRWDGLDIDAVRLALGALPHMDSQALPIWAEILQEIIQTVPEFNFQGEAAVSPKIQELNPIDPENTLPFEDVLLPVLLAARQKLFARLGSASLSSDYLPLELLSEQAYLTLERSLLENLVYLCTKTLESEFSHSRSEGHNLLNLLAGEMPVLRKKVHYRAFVQKLLADGLLAFFKKYPVLGRLVAIAIDFWVEATTEFLQRLQTDIPEIKQMFVRPEQLGEDNGEIGKVVKIKSALSDPHHHGRSVIALMFESGLKLIYKPKDLGMEAAYTEFLGWCNRNGIPLPFKALKVLNCQGYGWVEYLEQQPCEYKTAVQRFYQRAGMLLGLLYVLGGTDCHRENLVASGEHLVLVDMETLMHHEVSPLTNSPEAAVEATINQQFWDSVLRTGLLPRWDFGKDDRVVYDVSGLGSIAPQRIPWRAPRWKSVNTDDMHLAYETTTMPLEANVLILNGEAASPNDYLDELVAGFQKMYGFLMQKRRVLLATDGPLASMLAQRVRFVFRATRVYSAILHNSLSPEYLRSGVDWSIELDLLSRAFLTTQNKPKAWPILQAELNSMEQLDIPYFGANTESDSLTVGLETPLEQYFKEPSYNKLIARLQKLNQTDLAQQVTIIKDAFYARVARTFTTEQPSMFNAPILQDTDFFQISPLTRTQLLEEAKTIAQEIQERAIRGTDSSVNWIGLSYIPYAERFQLQPLTENLYDGRCGIVLFLAALDYVQGSNRFRDLALDALQSLQRVLRTSDTESIQRFARRLGIGGASGLSSIIYSLVKISQFLQEETLQEDAQRVASLITLEDITADQQFDVITGTAGTILGLLALYDETGEKDILDKAVACGQHLLAHQVGFEGSPRAWKTVEDKLLTGFSHGTAGIAYALLKLYSITHNKAYLEAADEGIAYERTVFSQRASNWPDFQSIAEQNGQPGFRISWCSGAPGIGLARLGSLSIYQTDEIHQDIEVALQTTHKHSWQGVDHLCCGNFGRIDVLLVAAQKLSRPQWDKIARQRAAWVVTRAKETGGYQLFANLPRSVSNPSFFQGIAGIGYELLRLAYPEALPSVLLWE